MRGSGELFDWEFAKDGTELQVTVKGPLTLDAPELMLRAALDGLGLAYVRLDDVEHSLRSGSRIRVLADWCTPLNGLHIYYPNRWHTSAALRALIEAVVRSGR